MFSVLTQKCVGSKSLYIHVREVRRFELVGEVEGRRALVLGVLLISGNDHFWITMFISIERTKMM